MFLYIKTLDEHTIVYKIILLFATYGKCYYEYQHIMCDKNIKYY